MVNKLPSTDVPFPSVNVSEVRSIVIPPVIATKLEMPSSALEIETRTTASSKSMTIGSPPVATDSPAPPFMRLKSPASMLPFGSSA